MRVSGWFMAVQDDNKVQMRLSIIGWLMVLKRK